MVPRLETPTLGFGASNLLRTDRIQASIFRALVQAIPAGHGLEKREWSVQPRVRITRFESETTFLELRIV